ncbi:MAG: PEP-CTERM sorting domain-containing protein [Phycisphaeraceae bacterium]
MRLGQTAISTAVALTLTASSASATVHFIEPGGWAPGDSQTTHQHWDYLASGTDNAPDVGHLTTPTGLDAPTLSVQDPGIRTSTGNFYAFSADYGVTAEFANHGGASGSYSGAAGTHVIIQTAGTLSGGAGLDVDSLNLVTLDGESIVDGDNASRLRADEIWRGTISSTFGDVTQQELILEFFLPGYSDDFRIQWDQAVHSSFDQLRVDTILANEALAVTPVPEPTSVALLGVAGLMLLHRRRCGEV